MEQQKTFRRWSVCGEPPYRGDRLTANSSTLDPYSCMSYGASAFLQTFCSTMEYFTQVRYITISFLVDRKLSWQSQGGQSQPPPNSVSDLHYDFLRGKSLPNSRFSTPPPSAQHAHMICQVLSSCSIISLHFLSWLPHLASNSTLPEPV